nr:hypothetical protein GCM10020092_020580 [Actinoplanes digitatis]
MRTSRKIAVVAHRRKTLGGGLDELRRLITDEGVDDLIWYEVPKSRKAPKQVRKALKAGIDLLIVWGGDGMVQRTLDALARHQGRREGTGRHHPGSAPPTCWPPTSASRTTWRRPCGSRSTAACAGSTSACSTASTSR